jgi:hypothetical protein
MLIMRSILSFGMSPARATPLQFVLQDSSRFLHATTWRRAAEETRCEFCFITFADPGELNHHKGHHCFPDEPEKVLLMFPGGGNVVDAVTGKPGVVLGPSSNAKKRHSSVSVRSIGRKTAADVPISRLRRG